MLRLLLCSALLVTACTAAMADVKRKDGTIIECYCTDKFGSRHEIGDIICLTVDDRSYMAKCVMAQNVPHWRDQKLGCLSSQAPRMTPPMTPKPSKTAIAHLLR